MLPRISVTYGKPAMWNHSDIGKELLLLIRSGKIKFAGNRKLKTYGTLDCASGKRMKKENRVFFRDRDEALREGYRPCGRCLRVAYRTWRRESGRHD